MDSYEATVTSKGQVTLPAALRSALRLRAGDKLVFSKDESGAIRVEARQHGMSDLRGIVRTGGLVDANRIQQWIEESRGSRAGGIEGATSAGGEDRS
jgi:AbrB family looped-hinge helix DNA binding protein